MKKLGPFLSLISLCAHGQIQPVPKPLLPGYRLIREDTLKADLTFLASDAMRGRMSLEQGDNAAIRWVAAEFSKAGLKPANGASLLQAVPLLEYLPDRESSFVTVKHGASEKQWKFPDANGGYPTPVDLSSSVIFAGYGITAPELTYDDYQGLNVQGRIVLVFEHEPQETDPKSIFNGTGNTRYATNRVKILNAQAHGAIGVLIAPEPNRKHPSNQERFARIGGSAVRANPIPTQFLSGDELHTPSVVLTDAVAQQLMEGGPTGAELQASIDRTLQPASRPLDSTITIHLRNASSTSGTSYNVTGLLEGSDPTLKAETIILSAHHDHDGWTGTEIWHGADDNGSGTVGVVALAHAIAANPTKPKRSILFVVFAAEERGLLGAFYMAQHPLRPLATTRAMINFDMIGRNEEESDQTRGLIEVPKNTTNRLNLIGAMYSPDFATAVQQENRKVGLDLDDRFDHETPLNVFFRSDQFPFVLRNIPAFWFFTGFHPDYHHTTEYRGSDQLRKDGEDPAPGVSLGLPLR
jgi:Zn-dependent M28 family amino/carboxypeptidase